MSLQEILPPPPPKRMLPEGELLPPPPKKKDKSGELSSESSDTPSPLPAQETNGASFDEIVNPFKNVKAAIPEKEDNSHFPELLKPQEVPVGQRQNEPASTQSVQPKVTASYDDFIAHNAERKEKNSKQIDEAIDNSARKVLKAKGVIKPEEEGKALNLSQYQQLNTERKRLQEQFATGDATFGYTKDGEPGLFKTIGWQKALSKGLNRAMASNDEANDFANHMTAEQKVAYLEQHPTEENKDPAYLGEKPTQAGSVTGMLGEAGPYLVKAAAGATVGAGLAALAPETGGLSLGALPTVGAILLTSEDAINHGAQEEISRRYRVILNENPYMDKVAAMKEAEQGYYSGAATGFLANAVLTGTGLKTPMGLEGKSVIGKAIEKTVKSGVHIGAVTGAAEGVKVAEGNLEGIKATPTDVAKAVGQTFKENFTAGSALTGLVMAGHGLLRLPNVVKSAFKYGLKDVPSQEISSTLKMNVDAGIIPKEMAEKVGNDIEQYKAAVSKTPNGLSPDAEASVAGLIQAKDKLTAEMKTKDDSAKPYYEEKIDGINQQIQKTINTGKPYAHEIDEVSGNKYTSEAKEENGIVVEPPRSFPEPITIPNERTTGEVNEPIPTNEGQPKEQGVTEVVQPDVNKVEPVATGTGTSVLEPEKTEQVTKLEKERDEQVKKIGKPELTLDFIPEEKIPKTKQAQTYKGKVIGEEMAPDEKIMERQKNIQDRFEKLKQVIDCLTS